MRRGALIVARLLLLAGPTVLAFFAGGYFDSPRAVAGLVAWVLVAAGVLLEPGSWPRTRTARMALGGLALFAVWTLLSITWAPIAGDAYHAGQIVMLYLGTLVAAALLLRSPAAQRLVEPALVAGTLVVIGYGLAGRMLPGLLHYARSVTAEGRLEQPLTYWNAMGELAALGFVLAARVAGDCTRDRRLRVAAAAACAPLGMGLYLSFSRGALFACAAGLLTLIVAVRRREQLAAVAVAVLGGVLAAVASAPFRGVTALAGSASARERDGAIVLALLALVTLGTALGQRLLVVRRRSEELTLPRRAPVLAAALIGAALALAIVVGAKESSVQSQQLSGGATRLVTLQSNRYDYWRVAIKAFATQPVHGVGAGNWSVYWLRYRHVNEFATDAHSLPLQTLAELGLVGLVLLLVFLGAVATAGVQAMRVTATAAGPFAGFVVYVAHSPLDWDWQMPAVSLVALVLCGCLLAIRELPPASAAAGLQAAAAT